MLKVKEDKIRMVIDTERESSVSFLSNVMSLKQNTDEVGKFKRFSAFSGTYHLSRIEQLLEDQQMGVRGPKAGLMP